MQKRLGFSSPLWTGLWAAVFLAASIPASAQAPGACAATPQDAWSRSREAVGSGDAGKVMLTLTPAYRTRNSVEYAVGAAMVTGFSGMSIATSKKPGAAAKSDAITAKLMADLDRIQKKHKAPTIQEIGKPLMAKLNDPDVLKRFEKIDHAAYARDMDKYFVQVDAAAREAGAGSGSPPKVDELVVGSGDMRAPLAAPTVAGDTARAAAGATTILFRKTGGCWLIDGREDAKQ